MLPAISIAIALSSWALGYVTYIIGQAITSILIAGMFTVISLWIVKLIGAFRERS
jgi:hypothetical protein